MSTREKGAAGSVPSRRGSLWHSTGAVTDHAALCRHVVAGVLSKMLLAIELVSLKFISIMVSDRYSSFSKAP